MPEGISQSLIGESMNAMSFTFLQVRVANELHNGCGNLAGLVAGAFGIWFFPHLDPHRCACKASKHSGQLLAI